MPLKIQDLFVDRRPETAIFRRMLAGEIQERILLITEASEMGKTWFLLKLFYECEADTIPVALIDFDRRRASRDVNYLSIAHTVSRHLGERYTPNVCTCERALSRRGVAVGGGSSGGVDFGKRTRFDDATIDAAGGDHIHDVSIHYAEAPLTVGQWAQQRADMGRALRDDLIALAQEYTRVVLLLDTFESTDEETRIWLDRWLLDPMRRQLPHVFLVVAGRPPCRPFFERPTLWSGLITAIDCFAPLEEEDVRIYSQKRGLVIDDTELPLLLDMARAGGPNEMANACNLVAQIRGEER